MAVCEGKFTWAWSKAVGVAVFSNRCVFVGVLVVGCTEAVWVVLREWDTD